MYSGTMHGVTSVSMLSLRTIDNAANGRNVTPVVN